MNRRDICCDIHDGLTCEQFTALPDWAKDVYAYVADPLFLLRYIFSPEIYA